MGEIKMKKLTNWELCKEIIVYSKSITRMIEDIELIKSEASKLEMTDGLRETITKVINQYNNQLAEIVASKWGNFSNRGENYFYKTFRKGYLLNFQDRMKDDLTVLSEYQGELLKAMDYIHKVQTTAAAINKEMIESKKENEKVEYKQFDLYDKEKRWIDSGTFKDMFGAVKHLDNIDLYDGDYMIIGNGKRADFTVKNNETYGLIFKEVVNTIRVTCETLHSWGWVKTIYHTTEFNVDDLINELKANRNAKNIKQEPL